MAAKLRAITLTRSWLRTPARERRRSRVAEARRARAAGSEGVTGRQVSSFPGFPCRPQHRSPVRRFGHHVQPRRLRRMETGCPARFGVGLLSDSFKRKAGGIAGAAAPRRKSIGPPYGGSADSAVLLDLPALREVIVVRRGPRTGVRRIGDAVLDCARIVLGEPVHAT